MDTKKLLVSFIAIASVLALVATVSAVDLTQNDSFSVKVNDIYVQFEGLPMSDPAIIAGENVDVEVRFTAATDASDVKVKIELGDEEAETSKFDIETDHRYKKVLTLKVPFDLTDELSDEVTLGVEIEGKACYDEDDDGKDDWCEDLDVEDEYLLRVQRPSYNPVVKSITASNKVNAGDELPVEIVVKNVGYNDLNDIYVTANIPVLGIEQTSYFGDLVADEWNYDDDDETDTISGVFKLKIPYDSPSGVYTLEVVVTNDDASVTETKQIVIENDFTAPVIKSGNNLIIVNPTDKLKVYTIIPELPASVSESVVVVPAGESKQVTINPNTQGDYSFNVNVFSGEKLVSTVAFVGSAVTPTTTVVANPIIVLTVVLAIIFLVLLVVLIVLIGKKPEKPEEFGESYY